MREFGFDRFGLDDVARTDLLVDALAGRADVDLDDPHDDALVALLAEWRDDLRWPPASALVSQDEAAEALILGMSERRRSRRALAAVGSVAASLLALSGFGALVADARPGDALYGLHAMLFNEPRLGDDQVVLSAKADLAKAEQMIAQGQWDQAQTQLAEVSSTLQSVNDGSRRQNLLNELNELNTKVERRDPNATLPASSSPQSELSRVVAPSDLPANSSSPLAPETESAPAASAPESMEPTNPVVSDTPTSPTAATSGPPTSTAKAPTSPPSQSATLTSSPASASKPLSTGPTSPAVAATAPGPSPASAGEAG